MKKLILLLFVIISFSFYYRCGNGSEMEARCGISGTVEYPGGIVVVGAKVRIRPASYLALNPDSSYLVYDTKTSNTGYFSFHSLEADSYVIEINKDNQYGKLISLVIHPQDTFPITLEKVIVKRTGAIRGRINLPITDDPIRPIISIYGVDYLDSTLITQDFIFPGIPPGEYNLMIIPYRGSNLLLELRKVNVLSDSTTNVGVMNFNIPSFFRGCNKWECDSLAVRSLLDSNNLVDTPVSSVVTIDPVSGRVSCLNLADKKLTKLTSNLGSLSELKYLDIRYNKISELPEEMGYLSSLTELLADCNMLTTLPIQLCYCDSLQLISLQYNKLNDFRKEFTKLKLTNLDLRHNKIQKLPDEIGSMVRLRTLHIDYNYIEILPRSITSTHLNDFSCEQNQLCMPSLEIESWLLRFNSKWSESQICE